jgi:hypothetical protein
VLLFLVSNFEILDYKDSNLLILILFTIEAPMGYVAIADLDIFSVDQRLITFQ